MTPDHTSSDVTGLLLRIRDIQTQKATLERESQILRAQLSKLYEEGKLSKQHKDKDIGVSATLATRRSYRFSDAVENLKQEEIINGVAEERVSHSWTIRALDPIHDA